MLRTGVEGFDGKPTELGQRGPARALRSWSTSSPAPARRASPRCRRSSGCTAASLTWSSSVSTCRIRSSRASARSPEPASPTPRCRDPSGDLLRNVGGAGLPTTLLLDGGGRVVDTHTGALSEADCGGSSTASSVRSRCRQHRPGASSVIDARWPSPSPPACSATVNPCGFAMLPAYLSYFLGIDRTHDGPAEAGVLRALLVGAVVSLGFVAAVRRGRRHHQLDLGRHLRLRRGSPS